MQLWLIFLILFASGFVQGFLGFGFAITALAIFPYYMDLYESHVLITFSIIVPIGLFSYQIRKHLNFRIFFITLIGAMIGLPIGLFCFTSMDPQWIIRFTGVVILLVALDGLIKLKISRPKNRKRETIWGIIAGVSSGFLSGAVGIAGPPIVAFGSRQNWNQAEFKAYIFTLSVIVSSCRAAGMIYTDIAKQDSMISAGYSIPFVLMGLLLGEYFSRKVNILLIQKLTFILLIIVSIGMLR